MHSGDGMVGEITQHMVCNEYACNGIICYEGTRMKVTSLVEIWVMKVNVGDRRVEWAGLQNVLQHALLYANSASNPQLSHCFYRAGQPNTAAAAGEGENATESCL